MLDRRSLLQRTIAVAFGLRLGSRTVTASEAHLVVLVRQPERSLVAIDAHTGAQVDVPAGMLPASPAAVAVCPDHAQSIGIVAGAARYRQHWPETDAHLLQAGNGEDARWWYWRPGYATRMLDLPPELEPAFPTDTCARWFHGARLDAAHLGSGSLRLVAVDLASGETVLDRAYDRRLELAATAVSPDGASVAHLQGGNTPLDLWLSDLRGEGRSAAVEIPIEPTPVAPAAIELHVRADGDRAVAVAGVAWTRPEHPEPLVAIASLGDGNPVVTTVLGELVDVMQTNENVSSWAGKARQRRRACPERRPQAGVEWVSKDLPTGIEAPVGP